ncbi:MAG TPA: bifunctional phosphopantothenoylcysteine decarboxylase/phosphopantothenate--cysteine ligase CoaBC [Anaerolineae bacterium]|nr:bifunctional phosphopantothenoylcysteine decarboxylase/phosphopantothenate--cysteine ligase CoaBC [Anaerolineae bacterium]
MILQGKSIVLGVTGGIAAYKAAALCSHLVQAGAQVDVILTDAAREFVAPLTFQALTHRPVVTEMFALLAETEIGHVSLAKRADLMIIAPATANTIAKLAAGMADNLLTTTALATRAPILIAPAMESQMWTNPLTQANVARLCQARDVVVVGPGEGRLASGASGPGRMAEPDEILDAACWVLAREGPLAGREVVITAGGTMEPLDPVRVLANRSSGKMGYALARAARDRGAEVTLISTTGRPAPHGARLVEVGTAADMEGAVLAALPTADVLLMAAAVADYRPAFVADQKMKKGERGMVLELVRTSDILLKVAGLRRDGQVIAGFAAETEHVVENAREKLERKRLDLIVANDARLAMGSDLNQVTLIDAGGHAEALPLLSKEDVAERILDRVGALLAMRGE